MQLVDTHTHLFASEFDSDIKEVIQNSIENGVQKMLLPNIDSNTTEQMLTLAQMYPENCYPMMGLHPCSVKKENIEFELQHVKKMLSSHNFIAVGEIGIDLYWDQSNLEYQKYAFETQINYAKEFNLPIVIHTRNSFEEVIKIVEKLNDNNLSGVFHCFSGDLEEAERIIALGNFYLGIGGVVTFKNGGIDKFINQIDLSHILLETDSPYLAPTPFRGKRNESKFIIKVAEKLSELYDISTEKISERTTSNANKLFKL